jgi:hypothetical protein
VWDEHAAMGVVAGFVAERLAVADDALAVVVLDESGQEKKGTSTCGVNANMWAAPAGSRTQSTGVPAAGKLARRVRAGGRWKRTVGHLASGLPVLHVIL